MTDREFRTPDFIREAFDEQPVPEERVVARSLERVLSDPRLDTPRVRGARLDAGLERLLDEVRQPPQRYAPFFDRVGELFDLKAPDVEALLGRTDWTWTALPGVRVRAVEGGPARAGCELRLVQFAAGAYFPRHAHRGRERVLLLEGGYRDDSGLDYGPGELHEMVGGSSHSFRVHDDAPCIAASVLDEPLDFQAWSLRMLHKFFPR